MRGVARGLLRRRRRVIEKKWESSQQRQRHVQVRSLVGALAPRRRQRGGPTPTAEAAAALHAKTDLQVDYYRLTYANVWTAAL